MYRSTRFWVRLAVSLALPLGIAIVASRPSAADGLPVSAAAPPAALAPAKHTARLQAVAKAANLTVKGIASPGTKLTPASPHSGGASIKQAGPGIYYPGPGPGGFLPVPDSLKISSIRMTFPTVANSTYVLDCSASQGQTASVRFAIGRGLSSGTEMPLDEGHILFAFTASSTSTDLSFFFNNVQATATNPQWHGCELSKLD